MRGFSGNASADPLPPQEELPFDAVVLATGYHMVGAKPLLSGGPSAGGGVTGVLAPQKNQLKTINLIIIIN